MYLKCILLSYENDLKAMRHYKAGLKTAERKGRKEGIRQLS
ncbi:hypothetical protein CPAST_c04280 [Clostridium pasteurianum DSM 525 = ATCC 6013]|uniref:Uncharacterized protein n=1 Tax=Clostridium pasteurianum DSM 525 = ATCC 6013 TaxID=1262449 RepID=A0A0H3J3N9_CLOPA|nr:hypothetical protein [Clostridium pasteurianum]AJA46528.1 hypothetical protein CPAST_c04280 [Clostridium pasteurianum DSM 525 = ATCC 6013]AJA50516.1 hypothetical protein CLPA_c04280 [Clostridium pasteurianum DSM 525 = ATCC 6013]KRU13472.1 hypothetical protein CP6013_02720 [Clostridium pasteurianum DSM 525 = ATCC 6013]UZW14704.1 hypothetical protein OSC52_02325 [Clostridium pasteurianum]